MARGIAEIIPTADAKFLLIFQLNGVVDTSTVLSYNTLALAVDAAKPLLNNVPGTFSIARMIIEKS